MTNVPLMACAVNQPDAETGEAAAGYALSRKEVAAALPGVAIAAALVPPLCVVGYGLGTSQLDIAAGSLLLFITNLIAIIFAAAITFLALGFHPTPNDRSELVRDLQVTLVSLGVIFVILAFTTITTTTELSQQVQVERLFNNEIVARVGEVTEFELQQNGDGYIINATVINSDEITPETDQAEIIRQELSETANAPVTLNMTIISGTQINARSRPRPYRQLQHQSHKCGSVFDFLCGSKLNWWWLTIKNNYVDKKINFTL